MPDPEHEPGSGDQGHRPVRARRVRQSRRLAWRRTAQRWVPETLRDSRIDPGRRGALLLTVVAAVAALVAAVGVWRDRPDPRPVQAVSLSQVTDRLPSGTSTVRAGGAAGPLSAPAVTSSPKSDTAGSPESTAAVGGVIVVSVTGAVHRPGLVRLAAGARVADAIEKAGGTTSQANLTGLNLAEKLTDGASVVVADIADQAGSAGNNSSVSGGGAGAGQKPSTSSSSAGGKLDLNTADVGALDALPGVGPVTAASIVSWRDKNGRFTSVEQLQEIPGIGPAKYTALSPLVRV